MQPRRRVDSHMAPPGRPRIERPQRTNRRPTSRWRLYLTADMVNAYREGDWWALEVPDAEVFTQCRRLDQAATVAREAIALKYDVPEDDILIGAVNADIGDDIAGLRAESRQKALAAEEVSRQAAALARRLVAEIRSRGYSLRDTATMLDLPHQRVARLEADTDRSSVNLEPTLICW